MLQQGNPAFWVQSVFGKIPYLLFDLLHTIYVAVCSLDWSPYGKHDLLHILVYTFRMRGRWGSGLAG